MAADERSNLTREHDQLAGAVDILATLREEFAEWLEEAQDESEREALENVLGHIESLQTEYTQRRDEIGQRLG